MKKITICFIFLFSSVGLTANALTERLPNNLTDTNEIDYWVKRYLGTAYENMPADPEIVSGWYNSLLVKLSPIDSVNLHRDVNGKILGWGALVSGHKDYLKNLIDLYQMSNKKIFLDIYVRSMDKLLTKTDRYTKETKGSDVCLWENTVPITRNLKDENNEHLHHDMWVTTQALTNQTGRDCWRFGFYNFAEAAIPMAKFANIVKSDSQLSAEYSAQAERYADFVASGFDYHLFVSNKWKFTQGDEPHKSKGYPSGAIQFCHNCQTSHTANHISNYKDVPMPLNQLAAGALALMEMSKLYPEQYYRFYAQAIIDTVYRNAKNVLSNSVDWIRWLYWAETRNANYDVTDENDLDDGSHGGIIAELFVEAYKDGGYGINADKVERMARTLTEKAKIYHDDKFRLASRISGKMIYKDGKYQYKDSACGYWMELERYTDGAYEACYEICDASSNTILPVT